MKSKLLFLTFFFAVFLVFGQLTPTISFDEKTKSFDTIPPSNRTFNVKLKDPGSFKYILLIKNCKGKHFWDTDANCKSVREPIEIPSEDYWRVTEGTSKYLYIRFGRDFVSTMNSINQDKDVVKENKNNSGVTQQNQKRNKAKGKKEKKRQKINRHNSYLEPMGEYSIIFLKSQSEVQKLKRTYLESFVNGNTQTTLLIKKYKELYLSVKSPGDLVFWPLEDIFVENLQNQLKEEPRLTILKAELVKLKDEEKKLKPRTGNTVNLLNVEEISRLIKFVSTIDSTIIKRTGLDAMQINKLLYSLSGMTPKQIYGLMKGITPLENQTRTPKATLVNNLIEMKRLKRLILYNNSLTSDPIETDSERALDNIIATIIDNIPVLSRIEDISTRIDDLLSDDVMSSSTLLIDTYIMSFQKRIKLKFTPDIGIVNYGFQSNFNEISPYLGFHYNLKYLDKDVPFREVRNKTLWHYLSIHLGVTLNSLKEVGKRKGLINDGGLMTGIGIRFNHTFRLTLGRNWFYRIDPNPLSTKKSITSSQYLGLSIDFEAKDLLNGFNSIFTK